MARNLTPEKALIFRITHRDNVPWILDHGLHCRNGNISDPRYVSIGNPDLIDSRARRTVPIPPGGTLSDYIAFYFTPFSPMLLNIKTGRSVRKRNNEEIVILVSSLILLKGRSIRFVFTDRHAYLELARFFGDLENLHEIDWPRLQARDFKRNPEDPAAFERYQAEALIYRRLPIDCLKGIVCYDEATAASVKGHMKQRGLEPNVLAKPGWYF